MSKPNIHATVDIFAGVIISNSEYFYRAIDDEAKLIEWYKTQCSAEVERIRLMYANLVSHAEIKLTNMQKHVEYLGLELPDRVIEKGELPNGS